ncbi:hypothetical protein [Azospirillum lipoferum]|uniref:Uncharacterized protein n=1 Tax=Azospirillum lipoferum (strain 4B) TaxID=862719 RepID=G7ZIS7_AZOL4|nr:hypothetical protein [Azospirillum lipoferum]CBS91620.1 protein of unknown function [Azospirillum lipoferum 4B]
MTTPILSTASHSTGHFAARPALAPAHLAATRRSTHSSAGQFAAADGKKSDFRSNPEPSGLTRGELRQIVLDILG